MGISLIGLDKADVLAALYNAAKPQGAGFLQYDPQPMTKDAAERILSTHQRFDYLKGRVMKIDLSGDDLDAGLYDRDNGDGAAERALAAMRAAGPAAPEIVATGQTAALASATETEGRLGEESGPDDSGLPGFAGFRLGLKDLAGPLAEKIRDARKALQGGE